MAAKSEENIFYVYEHWRPDTGACFYVGKGHGKRAWELRKRNKWHRKIVAFLHRSGLSVETKIIERQMDEAAALNLEIARIAYWRHAGVTLVNITMGGEGVCGLVHSAETKAILRAKRALQTITISAETKRKISEVQRGIKRGPNPEHSQRLAGKTHSYETKLKRSKALIGRAVSEETRKKIGSKNRGRIRTEETRLKLSLSHLGNKPSDTTRKKRSDSLRLAWARKKASQIGGLL